jgi:hypothetical protein
MSKMALNTINLTINWPMVRNEKYRNVSVVLYIDSVHLGQLKQLHSSESWQLIGSIVPPAISRGCLGVISRGLPTMWLHANNLRCVVCCKPEDWFVLSRFRLLYIHFMNIINNDISPIAVLQFNPISFGIHYINDVRLLRKHYVTRHGFRGAC